MNNKSILYVALLCAGLQSANVLCSEQQPAAAQGWGDWAYGQAAGAGQAVYGAGQYAGEVIGGYLSPYISRMQRGINEQITVLTAAARKEAGALGKVVVEAAKKEFNEMLPKIQEALLKGDPDAAKIIVMQAANKVVGVGLAGKDAAAFKAQAELKIALQNIAMKVVTDTQKEITATQSAIKK